MTDEPPLLEADLEYREREDPMTAELVIRNPQTENEMFRAPTRFVDIQPKACGALFGGHYWRQTTTTMTSFTTDRRTCRICGLTQTREWTNE